jgi:aryl-phospho-beta-D-glucosidase BglC (GH1 family)
MRLSGSRIAAAAIALAILIAALLLLLVPSSGAAGLWIGVRGNHLIDGKGDPIRLLGVNRPGTEYQCVEGDGFFEGPSDRASIEAMKSWHINAVRVPLNESCWLGISGVVPELGGTAYREAIRTYVRALERAGLYVILELQWAAPRDEPATGIIPMPDAEHAPDFWRSVAEEYRDDHGVLFDLYNEPHDISWDCWESGCETDDKWFGSYRAAGMSELVEAVRSTGAEQPLMLGGVDWSSDLRGWLAHRPADPEHALVASNHTYDFTSCYRDCRAVLARIARRVPVVTGELGEGDCRHGYIDPYMRWADRHGVSYLGWGWFIAPDLTCEEGPTLITDWSGTPTQFGIGLREHLRAIRFAERR